MLNEGKTVAEVARSACLTETTWHIWKNTYGPMLGPDMLRLKELEVENRRLKIIVADLELYKAMFKDEGSRKTSNPQIAGVSAVKLLRQRFAGLAREEPADSPVSHDPPRGRQQSLL